MVSFGLSIFYASSLVLVASGLAIPEKLSLVARDDKVLKLDFDVVRAPKSDSPSNITGVHKRDDNNGTVSLSLINRDVQYILSVQVGSQNREVDVAIDTESSDLWIAATDVVCVPREDEFYPEYCKVSGTFDPWLSTTWQNIHEKFSITYADGTISKGDYGKDDITFLNGDTIKNVTFVSASDSAAPVGGILGIGYLTHEAAPKQYPNFPELVVSLGLSRRNACSLYLNNVDADSGTLLFGGIDHAKYEGTLITLPTPDLELSVKLNSISSDTEKLVVNDNYVLDSGTSYTQIPNTEVLDKALHGYFSKKHNAYIVDCNPPADKYFTFEFDKNAKIKVPYTAFSAPLIDDIKWSGLCHALYSKGAVIGDNVLRSAYIVYDLDEKTISLAQAKYTSESNITAFPPKGNKVAY